MDETKWLALAISLLSCLVTHMWFALNKVSSGLSDERKKTVALLDAVRIITDSVKTVKSEYLGDNMDFRQIISNLKTTLDIHKQSITELNTKWGQVNEALKGIGDGGHIMLDRLDKLEGVKAPVKKTKKTKRKKS